MTDTVGRKRRSEVDGLGRLVKVIEQNPANGNLEWETSYSYDALDNLTRIDQGGQVREFGYDAKGRLTWEKTPEAGTTTYTYTNFDAVSTRMDMRGVVTTYQYGPLNLLTGLSYNNVTGVAPTAGVSIEYKTEGPGKGQIKKVTDGAGSETYGYDSFGRLQSRIRVIDGISYQTQYQYNAAGQMTLMIYPSGKRVKVDHDARGRLSALQRVDDGGGVQESYLSGINYRVEGLISSQNLGDGTTEDFGYSNDRLQLTRQRVTKGGATLLDLSYGYGASAGQMGSGSTAGNSGQIVSVTGTINGQDRSQTFSYDNVGRLLTATGVSTQGPWARRYEYDRHGNQTAAFGAVSGGNPLQNTVIAQDASGAPTNRIARVNETAFSYSANGNLTDDGAREYTYDAENRVVSVRVKQSGLIESYDYDAANHRVKKVVGAVETHYIWEGDQVIAEYERGGGATPATGTRYYHQDRLSTRVITNSAGDVVGTTDHLPFGEEIGLSGEEEKHKFTTYERDGTGIDYAVNRHYDLQRGRFNQVDPLRMGAASLADPQSLNLYSYVQNDPVNLVDPIGLCIVVRRYIGNDEFRLDFILCDFGGGGRDLLIDVGGGGGGDTQSQEQKKPCDPKDIKVTVDVPASKMFINERIAEDRYFSGVGSLLNLTFTGADGKPLAGASVTESNERITGARIVENPKTLKLGSKGEMQDLVARGRTTTGPDFGKNGENVKDFTDFMNGESLYSVDRQTLTVAAGGYNYEVSYLRTLSNTKSMFDDAPRDKLNENGVNVSVTITKPSVKCLP